LRMLLLKPLPHIHKNITIFKEAMIFLSLRIFGSSGNWIFILYFRNKV
jgi:hypothetical protein